MNGPLQPAPMSSIELTPSQKTILTALTNLHRQTEDAVKG